PGLHQRAQAEKRDCLAKLLGEYRALRARADEAQLAAHDVDQLRKLIQVRGAQETADRREPGVAFLSACPHRAVFLGVNAHAAEFDELEGLVEHPEARLA